MQKTCKNRGECCRYRETPVFSEDPEHRDLEGADDTDAEAKAHKLGESLLAMSTMQVPAESPAGIVLASTTEKVAAAKVEALGSREEGDAGHGRRMLPRNGERRVDVPRGSRGEVDVLRQGNLGEGNTAT